MRWLIWLLKLPFMAMVFVLFSWAPLWATWTDWRDEQRSFLWACDFNWRLWWRACFRTPE